MADLVAVSNGTQFYRIPLGDLPVAKSKGFYRPHQRRKTIVSDGTSMLEIPIADLGAARADGFRDLLESERAPATGGRATAAAPASVATHEAAPSANASVAVQSNPTMGVADEFAQAEEEIQAEIEELENAIEESTGLRKLKARLDLWWYMTGPAVLRHMRGSGVSIALHVAIILLLASLLLVTEEKPPAMLTVSVNDEESIVEEFIEPQVMEVTEPVEEVVEPMSEPTEVVTEVTEELVSTDFAESLTGNLLSMPTPGGSSEGDGDADAMPTKAKVQFFGSKTEAIDFVFVIDNSNSMTKGRFETALNELMKAVAQLNKKQKFYVIFYSDTAYPLFHPYKANTLVPATTKNKQLLAQWLQTVQLCLRTAGKEALTLAFSLKPDVMFVLGDGAFTDKASTHFAKNPDPDVIVHTLGMEVSANNAKGFMALAKAHRGTYRDVGVHPQGALMAKQYPRRKNNTRNGIWGLKLGDVKKK